MNTDSHSSGREFNTASKVEAALATAGVSVQEFTKQLSPYGGIIGVLETFQRRAFETRIDAAVRELRRDLDALKSVMRTDQGQGVLLYGCDVARQDPAGEAKARHYSAAILRLGVYSADLDEVMEVFENLRRVNCNDLKVLYSFHVGDEIVGSRRLNELAQITQYETLVPGRAGSAQQKIEPLFPSVMRMQSLGLIYVMPAPRGSGGTTAIDVGPLTGHLHQFAHLTDAGKRLVKVLPP